MHDIQCCSKAVTFWFYLHRFLVSCPYIWNQYHKNTKVIHTADFKVIEEKNYISKTLVNSSIIADV